MKPTARIRIAPWASGKSLERDGAHRHAADAGPGEHGLGDDRAAQQEADLQADQRDHRDHGVPQCVTDGDAPVRGALGARGAHIVGAERFEQRRARHARHRSDEHRAQGHGGQDDAEEARCRPNGPVAPLEGQQARAADILDQQQADPEHRHRHAHHRQRHDGAIDQGAATTRRQRAERDAERHRPDQAGQHQLDGRPEGQRDLVDHRTVGDHRAAEIELQHAAEITGELHPQRLVETELLADRFDLGLGRRRARDDGRRIGRHDLQQQEADQQHAEQDRQ